MTFQCSPHSNLVVTVNILDYGNQLVTASSLTFSEGLKKHYNDFGECISNARIICPNMSQSFSKLAEQQPVGR